MDVPWLNQKQLPEAFYKKGVLKTVAKLTGKHMCQSLFFNKVAGLRPAIIFKKRLWYRCFIVNSVKFPKTPFLQNTSGQLLLWLNTVCAVLILVIYGFAKSSSVTFVHIIFCFVIFNSLEILILFLILLVFKSIVVEAYVSPNIVRIGVSIPSQKQHPLFLNKPYLKYTNCPSSPF